MGTVEPVTWDKGEEELGPVCVGSCVRHGQQATSVMTNVEVFVCEFFSIDGYASRPVSLCEITSLGHKVLNHAMKVAPLVAKLLLVVTCAQAAEVFCSLWYLISVKLQKKRLDFNTYLKLNIAEHSAVFSNSEKNSWVLWVADAITFCSREESASSHRVEEHLSL